MLRNLCAVLIVLGLAQTAQAGLGIRGATSDINQTCCEVRRTMSHLDGTLDELDRVLDRVNAVLNLLDELLAEFQQQGHVEVQVHRKGFELFSIRVVLPPSEPSEPAQCPTGRGCPR